MFEQVIGGESANVARAIRSSKTKDTGLVCLLALLVTMTALRLARFGTNIVSSSHPARKVYGSILDEVVSTAQRVPWSGFVPTKTVVTPGQIVSLLVLAMVFDAVLYMFGLPFVHTHLGLFKNNLPRMHYSVSGPR